MFTIVNDRNFVSNKTKINCDMEVITMDSKGYKELREQIAQIAKFVYASQIPKVDRWMNSEEAQEFLDVSGRTLQRLRSERVVKFSILRGRCRYRLSELERVVEERVISSNPKTLAELTSGHRTRNKS